MHLFTLRLLRLLFTLTLLSSLLVGQVIIRDSIAISPTAYLAHPLLNEAPAPEYVLLKVNLFCAAIVATHDSSIYNGHITVSVGVYRDFEIYRATPGAGGCMGGPIEWTTPRPVLSSDGLTIKIGSASTIARRADDPSLLTVFLLFQGQEIPVGWVQSTSVDPRPLVSITYPQEEQNIYHEKKLWCSTMITSAFPTSDPIITEATLSCGTATVALGADSCFVIEGLSGEAQIKCVVHNIYGSDSVQTQIFLHPLTDAAANNVLLRSGGTVALFSQMEIFPSCSLMLNNGPVVLSDQMQRNSLAVRQWSSLDFSLEDGEGHPRAACLNRYILSDEIISGITFDDVPYNTPSYQFSLQLHADSSMECMPPSWVYGSPYNLSNPFNPSSAQMIHIPIDGEYRVRVFDVKPGAHDSLVYHTQTDTVLSTDLALMAGADFMLGHLTKDEEISFSIVSHASPLVSGKTMYPQVTPLGPGKWELHCEDWTDLTFDDCILRVELVADPPESLHVSIRDSIVWYGDTTELAIYPVDGLGRFSPFESLAPVKYRIELNEDSQQYGTLVRNGEAVSFADGIVAVNGVGEGVQFLANGIEPVDTVQLHFSVRAYIDNTPILTNVKKAGRGTKSASTQSLSLPASLGTKPGSGSAVINVAGGGEGPIILLETPAQADEAEHTIMLGETKYFYLTLEDGRGVVHETAIPEIPNQMKSKALPWTSDPIKIYARERTSLEIQYNALPFAIRNGVYWERKTPVFANGKFQSMELLSPYLIRVIGRYWSPDSVNVVRLDGQWGAQWVMGVVRPGKLGSDYTKSIDVHDRIFNIDDTCIVYGGRYGLPPHFLKAQIANEASPHLMVDSKQAFAPTYVYEPYTTQWANWDDARYSRGMWLVDKKRVDRSQWMGTGKAVPDHANVKDYNYPKEAQTVWDMIKEHSQLVDAKSGWSHTKYGLRNNDGTMNFYRLLYSDIANIYDVMLNRAKRADPKNFAILSRTYMADYLQLKWRGGAKNIDAQTRVASSYGLFQFLFSTAVEDKSVKYPNYNPMVSPEDLQEVEVNFYCAMQRQSNLLNKVFEKEKETTNNWPLGFESSFLKYVWSKWNNRASYAREVASKIKIFEPIMRKEGQE